LSKAAIGGKQRAAKEHEEREIDDENVPYVVRRLLIADVGYVEMP
jgi:hypothetical protein